MKYVKYCLAEISVYTLPFMGSRVKGTKRRWPRELWKTTAKDLKLREAVTNGGFETSITEKQRVCSPGLASFPPGQMEDKIKHFTATAFGCLRFILCSYPQ